MGLLAAVNGSSCTLPPELASGNSPATAQRWTGQDDPELALAVTWAKTYTLYRGIQADLPQLLNGEMDSCTKYTGAATSTSTITEDPAGVMGRFYWYLVTGSNGAGEGRRERDGGGPRRQLIGDLAHEGPAILHYNESETGAVRQAGVRPVPQDVLMRRWTIIAVILTLGGPRPEALAGPGRGGGLLGRRAHLPAARAEPPGAWHLLGGKPGALRSFPHPDAWLPPDARGDLPSLGHDNTTAVHVVQAVVDTATCWLVALLCALWVPPEWDERRRALAALGAFSLLAVCPLPHLCGHRLTETWTLFFRTLCVAAGSWALRAEREGFGGGRRRGFGWRECLFRPESGLLPRRFGLPPGVDGVEQAPTASKERGGWSATGAPRRERC